METFITHYTSIEGEPWEHWPFDKNIKPSNNELLDIPIRDNYIFTANGKKVCFHSLKFSNGREYDTINGFRDGGAP